MRQGLPLVLACTASCALPRGSAVPHASSSPLAAVVVRPTVEYFEGRLYASVWLSRPLRDGEVSPQITLEGANAPATAVRIDGAACDAVLFMTGSGGFDSTRNQDCSWALPDAKPGTYQIVVRQGATVLASEAISLVAEPAAGGLRRVAVDPSTRIGELYKVAAGWVVWLPVDARYERVSAEFFVFDANGTLAKHVSGGELDGPRIHGPGDPVIAVQPVVFAPQIAGTEPGWLVAAVGGKAVGAWQLGAGFEVLRHESPRDGGDLGRFARDNVPATATAAIAQALAGETSVEKRLVPRVCAAIASADGAKLVAELEKQRSGSTTHGSSQVQVATISSGGQTVGGVYVEGGAGIVSKLPRWDTGSNGTSAYDDSSPTYTRKLAALDRLAAKRGRGTCVNGTLPAAVAMWIGHLE